MENNRCVIVGAADIGRYDEIKKYFKEGDFFVYCDAGLKHERYLGREAQLIVGDFDSTEDPHRDVQTIVLPRIKDDTDTVYAVREMLRRGFCEFLLVGVVGGRLDHTLGNLAILSMLNENSAHGIIVDDMSDVELVFDKPVYISDRYTYFSLLNITGVCRGVTVKDAFYPLDNAELSVGYPLGVSNEPLPGKTASVTVSSGCALVVRVRHE